jgi:hypothetical protein
LLAQAALAVAIATAALRTIGTSRTRKLLPRLPWRLRAYDDIADIGWAIEAAGRRVPGARCLARAVAAEAILDRGRRDPQVHVGARRENNGELRAHAWVEVAGQVVVGAEERDAFTRLKPPTELST